MHLRINPGPLWGTVEAIPSKSDAHRLLILAALADAPTEIELLQSSRDIESTISCLQAMGAGIKRFGGNVVVTPVYNAAASPQLDCGESGSTLRFLLPVVAAFCGGGYFSGGGRLPDRPLGELVAAMKKNGVTFSQDKLPFMISGKLKSGDYELPGNVSSQYITGLLLALPGLSGNSAIHLTGRLESSAYVEMTLASLGRFGVNVRASDGRFEIPGGQQCISPKTVKVEGDWSNAAFFLAAGALGGTVTVTGLDTGSWQGDKAIVPILARFGALTEIFGSMVTISGRELRGCDLDLSDIPDLLPVLAVVAASASGTTRFSGCARLRLKESDRIASTAAMINSLGGNAVELPEGLVVHGGALSGGAVDSFRDHRIAMAAAVAAVRCAKPVTIRDAGAAEKSYPAFFTDYLKLGGKVDGV